MADKQTETKPAEVKQEIVTPEMLAKRLDVSGKLIRSYLRKEFTRPDDQKNTSWVLTPKQVDAVVDHFTPSDDDEDTES